MVKKSLFFFLLLVLFNSVDSYVLAQSNSLSKESGLTFEQNKNGGYRKNWAVLVGINYTGRQAELDSENKGALKALTNATNDAKTLAKILDKYFNYDPSDGGIIVLTDDSEDKGKIPTANNIREALNQLCVSGKVQKDDSFLFFFAGHGNREGVDNQLKGNSVALLPYDVDLANGHPVGNRSIGVPNELFELVKKIGCDHKLIVLDCCYSGEIFNTTTGRGFRSASQSMSRIDPTLQSEPTFQAFASCRATQTSADSESIVGSTNSKFTSAFIEGLLNIPARSDSDHRVWATRLLAYMNSSFDQTQRPDCRNLINSTGEFCFYPDPRADFSEFGLNADEKSNLKAMVVSRQGNWWFDEIPWFIPSVRSEIIRLHEKTQPVNRSSSFSDLISIEHLKKSALEVIEQKTQSPIQQIRYKHVKQILAEIGDAVKLRTTLENIESELREYNSSSNDEEGKDKPSQSVAHQKVNKQKKIILEPEDLHFLAVVQHALGKIEESENTYNQSIAAYKQASIATYKQASIEGGAQLRPSIMSAICLADRGELYLNKIRDPHKAALDFRNARSSILPILADEKRREDYSALFRIFTLCQEADAWLQINRWSNADELYEKATEVAKALAPDHYLQAHVYRRKAWSKMMQWKIEKAKVAFKTSNDILMTHFQKEYSREPVRSVSSKQEKSELGQKTFQTDESNPLNDGKDTTKATEQALLSGRTESMISQYLGPEFSHSTDHASKIAFLHNLHGIAMAERFEGKTLESSRSYRWLSSEVEKALFDFWATTSDKSLERNYLTRSINTQERLGDCNLFGLPEVRDPKEAYDDYRRALSRTQLLRGPQRERSQASLLYKQALALSLPSSIQDTELALEMCKRADLVFEAQQKKANGLWHVLGSLTTKTVKLIHALKSQSISNKVESPSLLLSQELRSALYDYRDLRGRSPHRDQLEMCLFCSKLLVEHGNFQDHYQTLSDADLLISFCRLALLPYDHKARNQHTQITAQRSESIAYLRPYYDTAMRAKLRHPMKHVKELLEIQAEATQGVYYVKPEKAVPIIALYVLSDESYLLLDLPNSESKCVALSSHYDIDKIREASFAGKEGELPLPLDILSALESWAVKSGLSEKIPIEQRWEDPIHNLHSFPQMAGPMSSDKRATLKVIKGGRFPFSVPGIFSPVSE